MVLKFLKNKDVPDELPDLISDDIEEKSARNELNFSVSAESEKKEVSRFLKEVEPLPKQPPQNNFSTENHPQENSPEKSFFEELEKSISSEISNLNKIDEWVDKQFMPRNILVEMKSFWEKEKEDKLLGSAGREYKEKISRQIGELKQLEREWQKAYFDLIEKEESLKEKEMELKKTLSDFSKFCKERSGRETSRRYRRK